MLDAIKNWIIAIAVSGILVSLIQALMPAGGVKKLSGVICGAVLMLAIMGGILNVKFDTSEFMIADEKEVMNEYSEKLEETNLRLNKSIIEDECRTYILDKAEKLGAHIVAVVTAQYDSDGSCIPYSVSITGKCSDTIGTALGEYISENLNIPPERQFWSTETQ